MSWVLIEHQALTSSVASVTLGSGGTIPQTYKTLKLVMSARTNQLSTDFILTVSLNGSTANFTQRLLEGDGTTAYSATLTNRAGNAPNSSVTASTFGNTEMTFPNYTSTTANKPFSIDAVTENNGTTAFQSLLATLWSNTAAITSIGISAVSTYSLLSGSSFTLYGLK